MFKKDIRLVKAEDSEALLEIYAPYIMHTPVTFECEVPPAREFGRRIEKVSESYPWLVCQIDDITAGYAYASQHNGRSAYQWSVNLSVYVKEGYRRKGLAGALYESLFDLLELLGYFSGFACITHPNAESEGFHQSAGFQKAGLFHNAGYKLGKWHDVIWYERSLKKPAANPPGPIPIKEADPSAIKEVLKKGADLIKDW